jgi:hypothetical protein
MDNQETGLFGFGSDSDQGRSEQNGEYTPSSGDLVRQWHDLEGYYREAKEAHERGEVGSTVPAGIQKQLMSVQEQIRRSQEIEGKLYTREDIGSVLSSFAKEVYAIIRTEVGEDRAAVLAEQIEQSIEAKVDNAN